MLVGGSTPEWVSYAKQLRPLSYQKIAARLGVTHNEVYYWLKVKNAGEPLVCETCGERFVANARELSRRYCSRKCRPPSRVSKEARQRMAEERRGRGNPAFKTGTYAGKRDREGERRFQSGQGECQHPHCERKGVFLHQHHVVYKQHVRDAGGDLWDPRNALALCDGCHPSHHRRGAKVVPLLALRDENFEFAFELLGEKAPYYLCRYYANDDPERLERFTAQLENDLARRSYLPSGAVG